MGGMESWRFRLPRWGGILLGIVAVLAGLVTVVAPLTSRNLLIVILVAGALLAGVLDLTTVRPGIAARLAVAAAIAWLAVAVAIAVWPGHSLRALAALTGMGLLASGVAALLDGFQRTGGKVTGILLGLAGLVTGIAVLIWSTISVLVVAAIVGLVLVLRGIAAIVRAAPDRGRARWAGGLPGIAGGILALLLAAGAAAGAGWIRGTEPSVPAFYQPPDTIPSEPGVLLRSEPWEHEQVPDNARAWRILYTTTSDDETPAIASGIVVVPTAGDEAPLPVISWAHGTTGFAEPCAPSILDDAFETGAMFVVGEVIDQGWAMVATDYPGLGTAGPHPYLIGQPSGRSVLDAARAARHLEDVELSPATVVWGHSQGGHAALWTGVEAAAGYAPEVEVIGIAALAAASNLPGLVTNLEELGLGSLFVSYMLAAYDAAYPDLEIGDYVEPGARIALDEMAGRCLAERGVLVSVVTALVIQDAIWKDDPGTGPMGDLLAANVPSGPIEVPLLIGQGAADQLVIPAAQRDYATGRCAGGDTIEYREYDGLDHLPLVEADSPLIPDLIGWTQDRFDGAPPPSNCDALEP